MHVPSEPPTRRYLYWLRIQNPALITLLAVGAFAGILASFEAAAWLSKGALILQWTTLFVGLLIRLYFQHAVGKESELMGYGVADLLIPPLWVGCVWNDALGQWMARIGFSHRFVIPVTSLFMLLAWWPLLYHTPMILMFSAGVCVLSALLRHGLHASVYGLVQATLVLFVDFNRIAT